MKAVGVFSVKGGVGKTLVALNIALRIAKRGRKVGFLDADWDNSNFHQFTGLNAEVQVTKDNRFILPEWNGVKVFSPSLMFGWDRGVSMTTDRYVQMISDVMEYGDWGDIEYVVIDLPAGSSDVWKGVLEIFGQVLLGDVVVAQPSMAESLIKGLKLHRYFDIPVIGVVENMSYIECPHGEKIRLFGESETAGIAEEMGYEYIGEIPFVVDLPKKLRSRDVYIESSTLDKLVDKILTMELPKTSFLQRLREAVLTKIKEEVEKVLVNLVVGLQKSFDFSKIAVEAGFTEQKPFILTITSEDGRVVLTRVPLKLKNGKLYVVSKPEKFEFEIATSFRTLARCILRKARVNGRIVPYDPFDAWASGDIKVYGSGFTPRAVRVLKAIFQNEHVVNDVAKRFSSILEEWI